MADKSLHTLIHAFAQKTRTVPEKGTLFGSRALRVEGICDGSEGVQWNAWVEWQGDTQLAYAGVNLEGKVYDGWPVARFVEREMRDRRLLAVRNSVTDSKRVEVIWYRDAWQAAARPAIREKLIAGSPHLLHELGDEPWLRMLEEAYACLDATRGHRGRGEQLLTTPSGARRKYPVSPHFQLRQAFWPRDEETVSAWRAALDQTMKNLQPLHTLLVNEAQGKDTGVAR